MSDAAAPTLRSVLFVSGVGLEGLAPALAGDADAICIDLEDAVPPGRKAAARAALLLALGTLAPAELGRIMVRINSLRSLDGIEDIRLLLSCRLAIASLVLPKVESDDELRWAASLADDAASTLGLVPIIETTAGLEHCLRIAAATPRVRGLFFGGFDLSTALGCEMAWEPLLYARSRVVHAAASAGVQVLDSPFANVDDEAGLVASALQARALGMTGKTAKQARQVAAINAAFSPSAAEVAHARRVAEAFARDPAAPLFIDGKLVELPTVRRMHRVLASADARAGQQGSAP